MRLSELKKSTSHGLRWNNSPTRKILQNPHRDGGHMVKSLTDSLVSREEEERHQKNLNENEQLKKQIAETAQQFTECLDKDAPHTCHQSHHITGYCKASGSIMLFGLWPLPSTLQLPN
ncbi:hypothetical protein RRG08_053468 [Elysia crispata]|uniref:Uncharacterized protein n=1 Tax=Elysia crispata TaxID=231223 RepID=A0AAE0XN56_9GAST|nr:hypothetical protein RRG08_053468 [Elysia crispata]